MSLRIWTYGGDDIMRLMYRNIFFNNISWFIYLFYLLSFYLLLFDWLSLFWFLTYSKSEKVYIYIFKSFKLNLKKWKCLRLTLGGRAGVSGFTALAAVLLSLMRACGSGNTSVFLLGRGGGVAPPVTKGFSSPDVTDIMEVLLLMFCGNSDQRLLENYKT